jgi:hypothetical protein
MIAAIFRFIWNLIKWSIAIVLMALVVLPTFAGAGNDWGIGVLGGFVLITLWRQIYVYKEWKSDKEHEKRMRTDPEYAARDREMRESLREIMAPRLAAERAERDAEESSSRRAPRQKVVIKHYGVFKQSPGWIGRTGMSYTNMASAIEAAKQAKSREPNHSFLVREMEEYGNNPGATVFSI